MAQPIELNINTMTIFEKRILSGLKKVAKSINDNHNKKQQHSCGYYDDIYSDATFALNNACGTIGILYEVMKEYDFSMVSFVRDHRIFISFKDCTKEIILWLDKNKFTGWQVLINFELPPKLYKKILKLMIRDHRNGVNIGNSILLHWTDPKYNKDYNILHVDRAYKWPLSTMILLREELQWEEIADLLAFTKFQPGYLFPPCGDDVNTKYGNDYRENNFPMCLIKEERNHTYEEFNASDGKSWFEPRAMDKEFAENIEEYCYGGTFHDFLSYEDIINNYNKKVFNDKDVVTNAAFVEALFCHRTYRILALDHKQIIPDLTLLIMSYL